MEYKKRKYKNRVPTERLIELRDSGMNDREIAESVGMKRITVNVRLRHHPRRVLWIVLRWYNSITVSANLSALLRRDGVDRVLLCYDPNGIVRIVPSSDTIQESKKVCFAKSSACIGARCFAETCGVKPDDEQLKVYGSYGNGVFEGHIS